MAQAQIQINLLTKEFRNSGSSGTGTLSKVLIGLTIFGCIGVGAWQFITLQSANTELDQVKSRTKAQLKSLESVQKIKAMDDMVTSRQNTITNNVKADKWGMTGLLASIQSKTPAGVNFLSLNIKDGSVDMKFEAASITDVEKFTDSLKSEKNFSSVELQSLAQESGKPAQAAIALKYKGGQGK